MFKGFKEFLSQGNIVDLAVAVVIGTAFTALVKSFTDSLITPLINLIPIGNKSDSEFLKPHIGTQEFNLNLVVSGAISFLLVAFVVYFFIVLPYNTLRKKGEVEQADDAQVVLLTEIRNLLAQNTEGPSSGRHGGQAPVPEYGARANAEDQISGG